MRAGLMRINRLTDGAVLPVVSSPSAVTLILVLTVPHTHTTMLAG